VIVPLWFLTGILHHVGALQLITEPLLLTNILTSINSAYTPNLYLYHVATSGGDYFYAAALSVALTLVTFVFSFSVLWLIRRQGRSVILWLRFLFQARAPRPGRVLPSTHPHRIICDYGWRCPLFSFSTALVTGRLQRELIADLYVTPAFWFANHFNFLANMQQLLTYNSGIYVQWVGITFSMP